MSGPDGVLVVDLRGEAVVLRARQWTPHVRRDPSKMRGVVLHTWDAVVGTEGRLRQRFGGEGPALARRAISAAYTISAGMGQLTGVPVVALAHPVERYTYASDSACGEYLAVGVMGRFAFEENDATANSDMYRQALLDAVDRALTEAVAMLSGEGGGPWALITHRQGVNGKGDHRECPGESVVAMAMRSSAVRSGLLVPDPDLVIVPDWGRPWPEAWRRHLPAASASRVASEHHACPSTPVGEDGSDDTHRA